MSFDLPRIGAPRIDNLCATLLLAKWRSHTHQLDRVARWQGFTTEELTKRFLQLETIFTRQPHNSFEEGEGK